MHLLYICIKIERIKTFIGNIEPMATQGDLEEVTKYYRAVFEVLENKLKTLDDSYGVIQNLIRDTLGEYIEYSANFIRSKKIETA